MWRHLQIDTESNSHKELDIQNCGDIYRAAIYYDLATHPTALKTCDFPHHMHLQTQDQTHRVMTASTIPQCSYAPSTQPTSMQTDGCPRRRHPHSPQQCKSHGPESARDVSVNHHCSSQSLVLCQSPVLKATLHGLECDKTSKKHFICRTCHSEQEIRHASIACFMNKYTRSIPKVMERFWGGEPVNACVLAYLHARVCVFAWFTGDTFEKSSHILDLQA